MPSKYLFLGDKNIANKDGGKVVWNNLPTLSEATRECYVSILDMSVTFDDTIIIVGGLIVKASLPSYNYFSSDNESPTLKYLISASAGADTFIPITGTSSSLELLTNDNIKTFEINILRNSGDEIEDPDVEGELFSAISAINLTLKIDYVDQKEIAQNYLSEIPMRL